MQARDKLSCFIGIKHDNQPMRITISSPFPVLLLGIVLSACSPASETVHETRFMMGTLVEFTIFSDNKENTSIAIKTAAEEMQRIEHLFTIYGDHDNAVKQFNQSDGTPFALPEEIDRLLEQSLKVRAQSRDAFSPTLGALNRLWGFSMEPPATTPPQREEIETLLPSANHCIKKQEQAWIRLSPMCQLDFGAIAKGYAIDRGMETLKQHGIANAIINAGGDIRVIGRHGNRPWQIGIRHPRETGKMLATLKTEGDVSIVTSGDYERFYISNGRRYHHILNPETGYPAHRSQSATVIASNATLADGWSTALFVMGQQGLKTIEKQGMEAIIVAEDGSIHSTKKIESRLQLSVQPPMLRASDS